MTDNLSDKVREFLSLRQGKDVDVNYIRSELKIDPNSPAWSNIHTILSRLVAERKLRSSGKRDGVYKVVTQVLPVPVFSVQREFKPPFDLIYPRDIDTHEEMAIAKDIIVREGDLILISGLSNFGKTALCLNFCGENIDKRPVLMGNEYTSYVDDKYQPTPRFINRLKDMDWVSWTDDKGNDKFTLLPVRDDYAEHIVSNRINIIDWINISTGEHYLIGNILEGCKKEVGRGIIIAAIQKAEGADAGRGGQFTRDFADVELLIDKFGKSDVLLTIGKVKEYNAAVTGRTFAYSIGKGVRIINFREVKRCPDCNGKGWKSDKVCELCDSKKYIDA